jgi:hypothetical protein
MSTPFSSATRRVGILAARETEGMRCQSVEFRLRFPGGIVAVFTFFAQGYVSAPRVECILTKA